MICLGIDIGTTTLRASLVEVRVGPHQRDWHPLGTPLCELTPFLGGELDRAAIEAALDRWLAAQGAGEPEVGTILVTGEAQRAANAVAVAEALRARWPALLSAQLDPELETTVAAHGSGAVERSRLLPGVALLHLDIGGGTTNLAWIDGGRILDTACVDLGARKWACDPATLRITRRTAAAAWLEQTYPELAGLNKFDLPSARRAAARVASLLLAPQWPADLTVLPWKQPRAGRRHLFVSGGVAACLRESAEAPFRYGDLGVLLAEALRAEATRLGERLEVSSVDGCATAFGISAFGFEVSGVSIDAELPAQELHLPLFEAPELRARVPVSPRWAVVLRDLPTARAALETLAGEWAGWLRQLPTPPELAVFVMRENLAKTFGYYLRKALGKTPSRLAVLDEIAVGPEASPGRTLDLKPLPETGRYAVCVKTLRLF